MYRQHYSIYFRLIYIYSLADVSYLLQFRDNGRVLNMGPQFLNKRRHCLCNNCLGPKMMLKIQYNDDIACCIACLIEKCCTCQGFFFPEEEIRGGGDWRWLLDKSLQNLIINIIFNHIILPNWMPLTMLRLQELLVEFYCKSQSITKLSPKLWYCASSLG